jgi:hypothetical protein
MGFHYDIICAGTALVDSIIKGFDPNPVSASGFRAASGSLNVGGEAVNAATAAATERNLDKFLALIDKKNVFLFDWHALPHYKVLGRDAVVDKVNRINAKT